MLRIWSEFLPYEAAAAPEVLDLLERFAVHPIFAVRPESDLTQLDALLVACNARDLEVGIWPLLDRSDGYWANERNARPWQQATDHVLSRLSADAQPVWIAVDLEPPLDNVTSMLRDPLRLPGAVWKFARTNLDEDRFRRAEVEWSTAVSRLNLRDFKTLGITVPLAAHDLGSGESLWQDLLETPWSGVPFTRHGVMAYNSMVAGYSRGLLSIPDARAAHDRLITRLANNGHQPHVSIGLTGPGVLGDEPAYFEPGPLALDAAAVRARGVQDIGLFCLEGLLAQRDPARWLSAVSNAEPLAPEQTPTARVVRTIGRTVPGMLRAIRRLNG